MKKCEICNNNLPKQNTEIVIYQDVKIYLCSECMHKVISYLAVLKGVQELAKYHKSLKFASIIDDVNILKKILHKEYTIIKKLKK